MPPSRAMYALPLAYAFMFFYLIKSSKKPAAVIITCFALFGAFYQAQITAQLFYSDQIRYNEDVRLAHELNTHIMQSQPDGGKLPVALVSNIISAQTHAGTNFLSGQMIGRSFFYSDGLWDLFSPTWRGIKFMRTLGIYFELPNRDQLIQAHQEAETMPSFPHPDSIRRMYDFIVVKLSD